MNARRYQVRVLVAVLVIVTICLISAAWKWTALSSYIDPARIAEWIVAARHSPFAPLMLIAIYLGASALMLPNTAVNAATILGLGTILGPPCALGGSMVAALTFYALGRRFGSRALHRLAPDQLERLHTSMERSGTLKVASIRLVPFAPFVVVNVIAGSARVGVLPFTMGTFLGLLPGNLLMTAFGHQLRALIQEPGMRNAMILGFVFVAAALGGWWLQRRVIAD